jgi:hypothetical protein
MYKFVTKMRFLAKNAILTLFRSERSGDLTMPLAKTKKLDSFLASNLLITVPFDIKISDYGLHVDKTPNVEQNLSEAQKRMTLLHMAPDLYQNPIMTPKSDIW